MTPPKSIKRITTANQREHNTFTCSNARYGGDATFKRAHDNSGESHYGSEFTVTPAYMQNKYNSEANISQNYHMYNSNRDRHVAMFTDGLTCRDTNSGDSEDEPQQYKLLQTNSSDRQFTETPSYMQSKYNPDRERNIS